MNDMAILMGEVHLLFGGLVYASNCTQFAAAVKEVTGREGFILKTHVILCHNPNPLIVGLGGGGGCTSLQGMPQ
jgi:hypothetical protein